MTATPASLSDRPTMASASAAPEALHVEVADSIEACRRLREPWLELRQRTGILTPNADPDRFQAIVSALPGVRPYVALFRDGTEPRALLVGRIQHRPLRYRIGYTTIRTPRLRSLDIVYGGLIVDDPTGARAAVLRHLRTLLARGAVDCLTCNHLRADHPLATELAVSATMSTCDAHFVRRLVPGSIEQTLARHSAAHRAKIRRYDRLLCEAFGGDVALRVFTEPVEVPAFLHLACAVAEQTYQHELGVALADSLLWRSILTAEAGAGRMRSYVLLAVGKPIAYQNGVVYGRTFFCDGRGYDPQYRELRPGNVLSHRIAADLCACHLQQIDYGFGDADYKRIYGTESWTEQTVRMYGRTARARVAWALDVASTRAARSLKLVAEQIGAIRRIKNIWRRRLTASGD